MTQDKVAAKQIRDEYPQSAEPTALNTPRPRLLIHYRRQHPKCEACSYRPNNKIKSAGVSFNKANYADDNQDNQGVHRSRDLASDECRCVGAFKDDGRVGGDICAVAPVPAVTV